MAPVQRLNRHIPTDDELELVRERALVRLAAMTDRTRATASSAGGGSDTDFEHSSKDGGSDVIEGQQMAAEGPARYVDGERAADESSNQDGNERPGIIVLGAPPSTIAGTSPDPTTNLAADPVEEVVADDAVVDPSEAVSQGVMFETRADGSVVADEPVTAEGPSTVSESGSGSEPADPSAVVGEDQPAPSDRGSLDGRAPVPVMAPPAVPAIPALLATSAAHESSKDVTPNAPQVAYCPYCATMLQPVPAEDTRCPRCKQRIVVRTADGRTVLLVEAAVPVFEAERQRLLDEAQWARERDHWLTLALMSGASRDRIAKAAAEPPAKAKITAARTLYISTVDKAFETAARAGRWDDAAQIRYAEALVLFDSAGVSIPRPPSDLPKAPVSARSAGRGD